MVNKLSNLTVPSTEKTHVADGYLQKNHNRLSQFKSVDHLVSDEFSRNRILSVGDRKALLYHMLQLRIALAQTLWANEIFIGRSLLDECIFHATKTGHGNVLRRVLTNLDTARADQVGFVLYPLNRFGMEIPMEDPYSLARNTSFQDHVIFRNAGFAATAQANSLSNLFNQINYMAKALGVKQSIKKSDLYHYTKSARWLEWNPMLMVRLVSYTGEMYENQFIFTLKIRIAASFLLMLHALCTEHGNDVESCNSSVNVNNFETLDIRHYLVGEAIAGERFLSLRRVPMNVAAIDLARLSDIAATISTNRIASSRLRRMKAKITSSLRIVEMGYLRHVNLTSNLGILSKLYRRLVTALDWFRASFGSNNNESEAIVSLAVAFETLLTDNYSSGVAGRIERRVGILMKGMPDVILYKTSVRSVYEARCDIVHAGDLGQSISIRRARVAFTRCFCAISQRIDGAVLGTLNSSKPIGCLLDD